MATILTFNSFYRDAGDVNNYSIQFSQRCNYSQIRLLNVNVPFTHSVFGLSNNRFLFIEASTPTVFRSFNLPPYLYDQTLLVNTLSALMTSNGTQAYNVTYNSLTSKINFSAAAAFTLVFSDRTSPWYRLGFDNQNTVSSNNITSYYPIDIGYTGTYYLNLDGVGIKNTLKAQRQPFNSQFPVFLIGNSLSFGRMVDDDYPYIQCSGFANYINVRLYDAQGNLVPLNRDWSFTVELLQ